MFEEGTELFLSHSRGKELTRFISKTGPENLITTQNQRRIGNFRPRELCKGITFTLALVPLETKR
jgi:hypothetical protein